MAQLEAPDDGPDRVPYTGCLRLLDVRRRPSAAASFRLVPQSTLGYGDITPAAGFPRMAAAVQAVVGQVFLVITVARMVGLQLAYSGRGTGRPAEDQGDV